MHRRTLYVILGIVGAFGIGLYSYTQYYFPYGYSHRCSKVLAMELERYANANDGNYPSASGEGDLGLDKLIGAGPSNIDWVVGKAGDLQSAKLFFEKNGFLRAEHSSWHYVAGLRKDLSGRIALAWDKIPLGHHGERTRINTREVIFVGGTVDQIPESEWDNFLRDQPHEVKGEPR